MSIITSFMLQRWHSLQRQTIVLVFNDLTKTELYNTVSGKAWFLFGIAMLLCLFNMTVQKRILLRDVSPIIIKNSVLTPIQKTICHCECGAECLSSNPSTFIDKMLTIKEEHHFTVFPFYFLKNWKLNIL